MIAPGFPVSTGKCQGRGRVTRDEGRRARVETDGPSTSSSTRHSTFDTLFFHSTAMACVFCKRGVPTRGHHVVPRCKGGKEIVPTCHSCEDFIHKTWSHNELRDVFNTVEVI